MPKIFCSGIKELMKAFAANLKGDILGGITAGIIALPLAIALGVASGLGATAGIYGAIIVGFFASVFGGTPTQITGPTGPMAVVVASIAALHGDNLHIVFSAIFLAGIFQILFGLAKVGKFVNFIPYPVISGFMSGIGAIIILLQLNPLLGIDFNGTPVQGFIHMLKSTGEVNTSAALLGLFTLLIVFLTPSKITKTVPAPLIALILATGAAVIFNLDVKTIGEIPTSFPEFIAPVFSLKDAETIVTLALTLAILGSIDSLLTSLVADSLTKTKHNPNKELIGQGLGNLFAGLFGGVASAGATMRTVVNIKSGGTTRLSGVIHSLFLIGVVLFLAPAASKIPLTVLAAILIKVGVSIIDYKFIKVIKAAPKHDLIVMCLVFLITVFDDLILAVGIGVVLSSILFAVNIAKQFEVNMKESTFDEDVQNKIMTIHINGVFFFGSASRLMSNINEVLETKCVIIDCQNIKTMDISAVFALEDLLLTLQSRKIKPVIIFNNRELAASVLKLGVRKLIRSESIAFSEAEARENALKLISA